MNVTCSTFTITQRRGIWHVTLDGVFFGDFRSKDQALGMAEESARSLRSNLRIVSVVDAAEGGLSQSA